MAAGQTLKYQNLMAPCGMNCGICIGYMREKKPCAGCFKKEDPDKPQQCRSCSIANCEKLAGTASGFCFECTSYPCARLKRLDQRYRNNYKMSMTENLDQLQALGLEKFLKLEAHRWTCAACGEGLCVHRNYCLHCNTALSRKEES